MAKFLFNSRWSFQASSLRDFIHSTLVKFHLYSVKKIKTIEIMSLLYDGVFLLPRCTWLKCLTSHLPFVHKITILPTYFSAINLFEIICTRSINVCTINQTSKRTILSQQGIFVIQEDSSEAWNQQIHNVSLYQIFVSPLTPTSMLE